MSNYSSELQQVIVGTAGHIDHGKTALVKALTGIDADTLAEEKRRGITIELGFVFMDMPDLDQQIVFIDVPGHEKLVKTMVAGASNIDAALLVIAADDGISAQTREHFDILRLLNIPTGVIALTKVDLVDERREAAVTGQIHDLTAGTFLQDAPIIPVSAITGQGVAQLRAALIKMAEAVPVRQDSGLFRMPIDRVFTMHGFGTVIAGTVLSGEVRVGDRIEIYPESLTARVRGIQIHSHSAEASVIGRRTALNIPEVKKDDLRRGQCAAAPDSLAATNRLDANLYLLESYGEPLKNRMRARLHVGTDEVICRLVLLDREALQPGDTAPVQFVLETSTVALPRDRFVIRTFSPIRTIGGGVIIDATPERHKRFDEDTLEGFDELADDLPHLVARRFKEAGFVPRDAAEVAGEVGAPVAEVVATVAELAAEGELKAIDGAHSRYLHIEAYEDLRSRLLDAITEYFYRYPHKLLMPLGELQAQLLRATSRPVLDRVLEGLLTDEVIYRKQANVGLVGRHPQLPPAEQAAMERIERTYRQAAFAAPPEGEVATQLGLSDEAFSRLMTALIEQGLLVRLSDKVTYHAASLAAARKLVTDLIASKGGITAAQLRDAMGVSRKYAVALLEYLDGVGVTRREGDLRRLR